MYKNILCAVDVSSEGEIVLLKAAALAELYGSQLSIAHIIEYTFLPKDYQKKLKEDVLPVIQEMTKKHNIKKKNRYVKFGKPYSEIFALENKHNIDLIVIVVTKNVE